MSSIHKQLIRKILSEAPVVDAPVPGEAESEVPVGNVITEPQNNPAGSNQETPSLFEIYPELAQMDPTNACALADYFATMCETQQTQQQVAQQTETVPSYAAQNTPAEF